MTGTFLGLPPSKRFKLLQQLEPQEEDPCSLPSSGCLPAKKRLQLHDHGLLPQHPEQAPATSCCLPAKKRVWAPHPLFDIEQCAQDDDDDGIGKDSKARGSVKHKVDGEVKLEAVEEDPVAAEKPTVAKQEEEDDDGVICAVCQSTDAHPLDPIVFCDGCDLMVHASCYGNPLIQSVPEGDWFCVRCEKRDFQNGDCCLCPGNGGATKPTTDGRWAHVLCALLVPEVFFHDPQGREGIDLSRVPAGRWGRSCCVCRSAAGCVVDCSELKCDLAFHVSCGLEAELCLEYREDQGGGIVVGFCEAHTRLWKKQQTTGKFKFVPREQK